MRLITATTFLSIVLTPLSTASSSQWQDGKTVHGALARRSHMDYSILDQNPVPRRVEPLKAMVRQAHLDAVKMAQAAYDELLNGDLDIFKHYFPTDKASIKRVRETFHRVIGDERSDSGADVLGDIRIMAPWTEDLQGICRDNELARTGPGRVNVRIGKGKSKKMAVVHVCQAFFYHRATSDAVNECMAHHSPLNRRKISMFGCQGATILHEWMHFNDIGNPANIHSETSMRHQSDDIVDVPTHGPGSQAAYSVQQVKRLVGKGKALINAANYEWFALHVYMERACAKPGTERRKIAAD